MPTTKLFVLKANLPTQPSMVGSSRVRTSLCRAERGFTLVELVVFIIVISIALLSLLAVYQQAVVSSVDPVKRIRMLELSQAQMDRVIALRYDEATPMGGIPACDSLGGLSCTNSPDGGFDDVDDYHNFVDTPGNYHRRVTVTPGQYDNGFAAKEIRVTVTAPDGESLTLTSYRYNF